MQVRVVRVSMPQAGVLVGMAVRLAAIPRALVLVLVMRVMRVLMRVSGGLVYVLVLVPLGKV